jgi:glycosyltransferase involved in cell wall biosynthesis
LFNGRLNIKIAIKAGIIIFKLEQKDNKASQIENKPVKYSVCITNYNSIDTIQPAMDSIIHQFRYDSEIIVCDNFSNDGSLSILQEYARNRKIKLIVQRSSRGKGRQVAFENSTGEYIISGLDTDDRLKPVFQNFLELYHKNYESFMLSSGTIHIIPRQLIKEIGGWNDLQFGEDVDFYKRAQLTGKHRELPFTLEIVERGHNKRNVIQRVSKLLHASLFYYRMGKSISDQVKLSVFPYKFPTAIISILATIFSKVKKIKKLDYMFSK